eukprot:gnl/TRDRNA2_/TRDRNA2_30741_c0_seq1.p1 gnl/TRDRNA2_/TRDRNA2_30741_c0~~gnl/TRDRNA2_/TRDRNA2_30741_c0_seq1.p1  ORF type:complete len:350 (+),score=39.62 gnl/TRDRNA2_/TRDRNA2_30741_c0_seq1:49-1098(+)
MIRWRTLGLVSCCELLLGFLLRLWTVDGEITSLRVSDGNRSGILARLKVAQQTCREYRVIDVGAAMKPWTRDVVDTIVDFFADEAQPDCFAGTALDEFGRSCCQAGADAMIIGSHESQDCFEGEYTHERCCKNGKPKALSRFSMDVNSESAWAEVLAHVEQQGKFDFAVATHILEDIANPATVVMMLPRIAKRGIIASPTKFLELKRGIETPSWHIPGEEPAYPARSLYRGHIHHRWIFTVKDGTLVAIPKLPFLETESVFDRVASRHCSLNATCRPSAIDLGIEWEDDIPFRLLNRGFMGPTPVALMQMFVQALVEEDDVDHAAGMPGATFKYGPPYAKDVLPCADSV